MILGRVDPDRETRFIFINCSGIFANQRVVVMQVMAEIGNRLKGLPMSVWQIDRNLKIPPTDCYRFQG